MTPKQRALINHILDTIDLQQNRHRESLVRVLANNEYRSMESIPDAMASSIIWKLQFITAKEHDGQLH